MATKLLLALFCFCAVGLPAQVLPKESLEYAHPFQTVDAQVLQDHLSGIADSCTLVGLGEVSHYTQECYLLKHEIIKVLRAKGFSSLILEVDFGQALLWNEYVLEGKGNLDTLVAASGWFTYRTEEFRDLLQEVRAYNLKAETPFQIFGMEMTAMGDNLKWLSQYLQAYLPQEKTLVERLAQERKTVAFQPYEPAERLDYWNLYHEVLAVLSEQEAVLVEQGGAVKFRIASRIGEIVRQFATYISQDEFSLQIELRDQFSSRNVLWAMDHVGEGSKAMIWAHNGHIAKESILFSYDVLGHYLTTWFGEAYYSVGFTFNQGEFGAFSNQGFQKWSMENVDQASLTQDFHQMGQPYVLFDVRSQLEKDRNLDSYLRTEQLMRRDISESYNEGWEKYMQINLSTAYDCLIYIEESHYPTTIPWLR